MNRNGIVGVVSACALVATLALPAGLSAQAGTAPKAGATSSDKKPTGDQAAAKKPAGSGLMSVHIPRKVSADGHELAAGTYSLRLSEEAVKPVVGETPGANKWVEFVQGGSVKGRELATVLTAADAKQIAKQGLPAAGAAKVELLKGDDYLRVWVNIGGTNYLIHLTSASM